MKPKFHAILKFKPTNRFRSARVGALTFSLILLPLISPVSAIDIDATGTQAASADQWNLATWVGGQWSDGLAPSAGRTYSTGAFQIRTLNSTSTDTTFGGDSLRIVAGGSLLFRNGNTNVVNGNLILDGGSLISGRTLTGGNAQDFVGSLNVASTSFIDLTNGGAGQNRIAYMSGNFTGSGDITMSGLENTDVMQIETAVTGSHTGNWTINGGRLVVTNDNHIGSSARVTMGSASTAFFEIRSDQTIGSLSGNGTVQTNSGSRTLTTGGDGTTTTFDGVITTSGIALTKEGAGTFTLSNTHTFAGPITINGGTLEFTGTNGGNDVFGSTVVNINGASTLKVSGTAANVPIFANRAYTFNSVGGGSILLGTGNYDAGVANQPFSITTQGGAQNTIGLISTSGANGFNLGGSVATFDVALGSDAASDLVVTPIMSNNGSVLKTGAGRLALAGANTYGGSTTITGGTLTLGASGVIPDASPVTLGAATLNAATSGTESAGTLDVTGTATINLGSGAQLAFTSGTATWAGTLDITGAFVSGSSLNFGSSSGLSLAQLGAITLNGNPGTFTLNGSGFLLSGAVSGYAAWQSANGTMQAANLDHDNDGVSNGVEHFIFGTANSTGNSNPLPGVDVGPLSVTWTKAATYTGSYGTGFVVETSATLSDPWTTEIEDPNPGFTVTFPSANEAKYTFPAGTRNFARLKVVAP